MYEVRQERLFKLAVEAVTINAHYEPPNGWVLVVNARRGGDGWGDEPASWYDSLSTPELADVVAAELERLLGL